MSTIDNPKFLIVDDFDAMLKLIKSTLMGLGFTQIATAKDGNAAIQYLKENPVDCIVSDWNMPKVTGLELLKHVRSSDELKHIPFMLVTAEVERDNINQAISAGVNDFLVKPFTPISLREKIKNLLSSSSAPKRSLSLLKESTDSSPSIQKTRERPTVLIVDDIPSNIDVITGILKGDFKTKAATSGEKALKIVSSPNGAPDLILLDIMMPEMNGMEVCKRLKENPETEHIPVIFLTAKSEVDDITAGFEMGAVDYIFKPVNPAVLRARVNTQLKLKRGRDELSNQVDTLVENSKLREDVDRIIRHDLKNPLTAILHSAESLMEDRGIGSEQKKNIEVMRTASYSMLGMINRSLDLYKMEMGSYQFNPESMDIVKTLSNVIADSRATSSDDISIQLDAPETSQISAEELLCFSLFSNLVRNAVEASNGQGSISVKVENTDGKTLISIHNSGMIPEEIQSTFFDKYVTSGKSNGTGIGTYSAKLVANVQNADISFTSSQEAGTTITVSFPL